MTHYPLRIRLGTILSQFVHTLIGGHPDLSLSSAAHVNRRDSAAWERVARIADRIFGAGHCEESFEADCQFAVDILEIKTRLILELGDGRR